MNAFFTDVLVRDIGSLTWHSYAQCLDCVTLAWRSFAEPQCQAAKQRLFRSTMAKHCRRETRSGSSDTGDPHTQELLGVRSRKSDAFQYE